MPSIVIDTNVLLSGLLYGGTPLRVLERLRRGYDHAYASEAMARELLNVVARPKFAPVLARVGHSPRSLVEGVASLVQLVPDPPPSGVTCRDPQDQMVLDCADSVGSDYLISGDQDLLSLGTAGVTRIVTPAQFLALVDG